MKYLWMVVVTGVLSLVSACGGGSASEPGVPVTSTTQTLGAGGGSVTLQGLSLAVPAAALAASTELGLQQETVASPALARFRFSPAGQALAVPAELRYSAAGLPANARFFWEVNGEQWLMPGTVSGGVLVSQVNSLGYNGAGTVVQSQALTQAASLTDRVKAAAARVLAQADGSAEGGSLVVAPVDCDVHITELKLRLARAATDGDQNRAAGVFNDLQATREACAGVRVQEIEQASCDALSVAQSRAETIVADSLVTFNELTVPLHAAEAFVNDAGATCSNADPGANPRLINAKFDQLLDVMKGQMARGEFDDALIARDLRVVMHLDKMCQKLDLGPACDRLVTELYPDLLDALRASAFQDCRVNATPLSVSQFYALGSQAGDADKFYGHGRFPLAAVEEDLSYCNNPSLDLKVFPSDGPDDELTDRATTLSPLVGLGQYAKQRRIEVPREGALELSGTVGVLRCPDGSASGADLVVRINGHEWRRRPASGTSFPLSSGATLRLAVGNALPSVGIDPDAVDGFTVTVNREGGACSDGKQAVLDAPFTLFEVQVNLPSQVAGPAVFEGRMQISHVVSFTGSRLGSRRSDFEVQIRGSTASSNFAVTGLQSAYSEAEDYLTFECIGCVQSGVLVDGCGFDRRNQVAVRGSGSTSRPGVRNYVLLAINPSTETWTLREANLANPFTTMQTIDISTVNIRGDCSARSDMAPRTVQSTQAFPDRAMLLRFVSNPDSFGAGAPLTGEVTRGPSGLRQIRFRGTSTYQNTSPPGHLTDVFFTQVTTEVLIELDEVR